MGLRPNNELVALAWVGTAAGVPAGKTATTLPSGTAWSSTGFVVVTAVGGSSSRYVKLRRPVFQVDCWAVAPGSSTAPWGQANALAESVVAAAYDEATMHRTLTLPAGYDAARVLQAGILGEPVRVTGDEGHFARYRFDLELSWIAVPSS